ncbi:UDP-3-O-(3-hydroxymyristoyl)glucosamine N-acyltransferase [bacterium AH-315-I18]|nr:UDP-3-O-(3-hydroxymyristoyl)glucosamine N-acyltransferase [Phycisphaeraceae bacterium]MBN4060870.1 UDP-3-O-(3-hydroxymyristoyl)glucosamine N-acyltransferase [bacterium AH-315-I18]
MPSYTITQLAKHVDGQVTGLTDVTVTGIQVLDQALASDLSFIRSAKFAQQWSSSAAAVVLLAQSIEIPQDCVNRSVIRVEDADMALNKVIELFAPPKVCPQAGIHPTAVVSETATLGNQVCIGPYCIIGDNVQIGEGCVLHNAVSVYENSSMGSYCEIYSGVVIRERSQIGHHVMIHCNAVIGADGFGFRASDDGQGITKIPHIGNVIIGNHVEIGANSCVDRAKFSATTIGDGTKIDNLCQIAHNVQIGRCCLIAAQVGVAGSTTVGDGVQIGGQVGIRDNISIGSGVKLAACAAVMGDIPDGETWMGIPAKEQNTAAREFVAIRKLPELLKVYKEFSKQMKND